MNAPAEAFRCQALAKEIVAELRAKYDLKAAGQRVLITKFDHDPSRAVGSARHKRCSWPIGARQEQWLRAHPQATAAQAATLAPRPPFNARVETVTTKPFFREPFTPNGGLVVQSGARSLRHRDAIISLAARYKLPAVYSARDYASVGGLLSYGPDQIGH
jgi:putative SOS response-associated peptidase YedK